LRVGSSDNTCQNPGDAFFQAIGHELHRRFGIEHVTIQIELGNAAPCPFAPEHVIVRDRHVAKEELDDSCR
jgi:hypothetical protein